MTTGQMLALGAVGVAIGATGAYLFFRNSGSSSANTTRPTPVPNPASAGHVGVGYVSPGAGTRDWWHDRNERRRRKHLKMMTAKG